MEMETGLSRKHQEKARKILRSKGVIEEQKKGVPRRLWYLVDLEALLRIMQTPNSTMNQGRGNRDDGDASEQMHNNGYSSLYPIIDRSSKSDSTVLASGNGNTFPSSEDRIRLPASKAHTNNPAITESTSETTPESSSDNYSSENPLLQSGASRALHGSAPKNQIEMTTTPKSSGDALRLQRIYNLLTTPGSKVYGAYRLHQAGSLSLLDLASEVCLALTGSRDQSESYAEPVRRMVAELAIDGAGTDALTGAR